MRVVRRSSWCRRLGSAPPLDGHPARGGGSPSATSQRSDTRGRPAYGATPTRQAETSHCRAARSRQEMSYLGMECYRPNRPYETAKAGVVAVLAGLFRSRTAYAVLGLG